MEDEINGKKIDNEREIKRKKQGRETKKKWKKYASRHSHERLEGRKIYLWLHWVDEEVEKEEEK